MTVMRILKIMLILCCIHDDAGRYTVQMYFQWGVFRQWTGYRKHTICVQPDSTSKQICGLMTKV